MKAQSKIKTNLSKIGMTLPAALLAAAGLILAAGCASKAIAPKQSGFLTHYHHMVKIDDTTWRYMDTNRMAMYNKFQITAAKCMVTEYDGKPLSPTAQQKVADYLREAITKALADRYPIVTSGGVDVGEIRVAITQAYKTGNRLGLTVEGEIDDSFSTVQAVAVMRTELGEIYLGDWWDSTSAKQIMDAWAARLRSAIDITHTRRP
jgi:hypothetical protein